MGDCMKKIMLTALFIVGVITAIREPKIIRTPLARYTTTSENIADDNIITQDGWYGKIYTNGSAVLCFLGDSYAMSVKDDDVQVIDFIANEQARVVLDPEQGCLEVQALTSNPQPASRAA